MRSPRPERAVIGLDIGGTSTTAAVLSGHRIRSAVTGPGANQRSSGGDSSAQLADLLAAAVQRAGDPALEACVAGISGAGPAGIERAQQVMTQACGDAGITPQVMRILPDPDIAFAAGSPGPDGALLLAGTGAIACRYRGFSQIRRTDGLGWMLGDIGGGIWIALEGFRAAASALDGRGQDTSLSAAAIDMAGSAGPSTDDPRQDLVRLTDHRSPAELGRFARTVADHAQAGDAVATEIIGKAADALLHSLETLDDAAAPPVVLAGSALTTPGPLREHILSALGERAHDARPPVLGALRLAAQLAGWEPPGPTELDLPRPEPIRAAPPNRLLIDHYRPQDRETLYEICLLTGDSGQDASSLYRDPDLLGHMYLGAYLEFEPHLARVLRREDGVAVGYCVATADTSGFEDRCEKSWWPPLQQRYGEPADSDDSRDARLIRRIHQPTRTEGTWLPEHPAHLHIDLLPEAQGAGNGSRLLTATLEALTEAGAPGVHLGVGGRNIRAIGFYENMGLRTLQHLSYGLMMGSRLPRRETY